MCQICPSTSVATLLDRQQLKLVTKKNSPSVAVLSFWDEIDEDGIWLRLESESPSGWNPNDVFVSRDWAYKRYAKTI